MTYIISGYNPRAGLRGTDWLDPASYTQEKLTAEAQKAWTAASDAAAIAVGLKQPPKPKAPKTPGVLPPGFPTRRLPMPYGTQSYGTQYTPPGDEKDNTMLYVGGAVALVVVLAMMQRK